MSALIVGAAALSAWPSYRSMPEGAGLVRLSFSHGGQKACRDLTEEELAKLPPNMRRKQVCDRQRPPLYVELDIDGATIFSAVLPSTGIAGDGPSRVYRRFVLPAGPHDLAVRLRDTSRPEGFDHAAMHHLDLAPDQSFAIDFNPALGGFTFR
jgi:uncharacterized protein YbdZ (MbtH family)